MLTTLYPVVCAGKEKTPQASIVHVLLATGDTVTLRNITKDGKKYVSIENVASIYKSKVHWYPVSGKVILTINKAKLEFIAGRSDLRIGDNRVKLTSKILFYKSNIWVPLELLDNKYWKQLTNSSIIGKDTGKTLVPEEKFDIYDPRIYSTSDRTKCVFELGKELEYQVIVSTIPGVYSFHAKKAKAEGGTHKVVTSDNIIKSLRVLQQKDGAVYQIGFQSATVTELQTVNDDTGRKLLLEFIRIPAGPVQVVIPSQTQDIINNTMAQAQQGLGKESAAVAQPKEPVIQASIALPQKRVVRKIMIDPGHGGKDCGAIGPKGVFEKDLVLDYSKELAKILKDEYKYEVILTRTTDEFIPLSVRTEMANTEKADIFISVHCNASYSRMDNGFEVYFLSENASDAAAEAVAKLENAVVQLEDPGSLKKFEVDKILCSLETNVYMNQSSELSGIMKREVDNLSWLVRNNGVKQASFFVLRGTRMPAVLLEAAYLSNPAEERKLTERRMKTNMVDAWARAVVTYEKRMSENGNLKK
ncbi:MAG: N-acetylmuramoyl-L-alanine amidase [Elusimicrobiota bacterium]